MSEPGQPQPGGRQIAQLALPALGVLAAEPLYLLFDTAIVGRLGALSLAGLAIGALTLGLVGSDLTFLSYGTTARSARYFGAGDRNSAVAEGVQATWLALGLGALIVVVVEAAAAPVVSAVAGSADIASTALSWLRIAIVGAPAILVSLAGNGWLRGVQDTLHQSEEQRRAIETEIDSVRADRARLSAALIDTTAKVQDAERAAARALRDGVEVTVPSAPFIPGGHEYGLRVCLGAAPSLALLEQGLRTLNTAVSERTDRAAGVVTFDFRGHGRSGKAPPETYTVTQLGRDLETVLQVIAPRGPIVLVGHSMGGMTVLSHARQYPRHYGGRIAGAALISSAAEGVAKSPLGEILNNPALEAVRRAARSAPKLVHRGRNATRSLIGPILRAASYSNVNVSPSIVAFSDKMMLGTPIPTMVEFLHALEVHDETAALPTLAKIPTLIVCGEHDLVTPAEYSKKMAETLPDSELVIVARTGHLVLLDKPEPINDGLVRLVKRATPSRLAALSQRWRDRVLRRD